MANLIVKGWTTKTLADVGIEKISHNIYSAEECQAAWAAHLQKPATRRYLWHDEITRALAAEVERQRSTSTSYAAQIEGSPSTSKWQPVTEDKPEIPDEPVFGQRSQALGSAMLCFIAGIVLLYWGWIDLAVVLFTVVVIGSALFVARWRDTSNDSVWATVLLFLTVCFCTGALVSQFRKRSVDLSVAQIDFDFPLATEQCQKAVIADIQSLCRNDVALLAGEGHKVELDCDGGWLFDGSQKTDSLPETIRKLVRKYQLLWDGRTLHKNHAKCEPHLTKEALQDALVSGGGLIDTRTVRDWIRANREFWIGGLSLLTSAGLYMLCHCFPRSWMATNRYAFFFFAFAISSIWSFLIFRAGGHDSVVPGVIATGWWAFYNDITELIVPQNQGPLTYLWNTFRTGTSFAFISTYAKEISIVVLLIWNFAREIFSCRKAKTEEKTEPQDTAAQAKPFIGPHSE